MQILKGIGGDIIGGIKAVRKNVPNLNVPGKVPSNPPNVPNVPNPNRINPYQINEQHSFLGSADKTKVPVQTRKNYNTGKRPPIEIEDIQPLYGYGYDNIALDRYNSWLKKLDLLDNQSDAYRYAVQYKYNLDEAFRLSSKIDNMYKENPILFKKYKDELANIEKKYGVETDYETVHKRFRDIEDLHIRMRDEEDSLRTGIARTLSFDPEYTRLLFTNEKKNLPFVELVQRADNEKDLQDILQLIKREFDSKASTLMGIKHFNIDNVNLIKKNFRDSLQKEISNIPQFSNLTMHPRDLRIEGDFARVARLLKESATRSTAQAAKGVAQAATWVAKSLPDANFSSYFSREHFTTEESDEMISVAEFLNIITDEYMADNLTYEDVIYLINELKRVLGDKLTSQDLKDIENFESKFKKIDELKVNVDLYTIIDKVLREESGESNPWIVIGGFILLIVMILLFIYML